MFRSAPVVTPASAGVSDAAPQMSWIFALTGPDDRIFATGLGQRLRPGPADTLGQRVRDFFAEQAATQGAHPGDPGAILVGAMPFDRAADDFLYQPAHNSATPWELPAGAAIAAHWDVRPHPARAEYMHAVEQALAHIARSQDSATPLHKIVLSRSLVLEADHSIDVPALWARLNADPSAVRFLTSIGSGRHGEQRHLVGATPELLLRKKGAQILSHPRAGSARRSSDAARDRAAADSLAQSPKDQREHQWVVEAILDALAPYCSQLSAPKTPAIVSTDSMWHLGTRIEGVLKQPDATHAAELAALLHPTPAVGGTPHSAASALIPKLEGYDRGFYAGAVGWVDAGGDGAWYVSLRCAEVSGNSARVYAGAGIVEGSTPEAEAEETSAKLVAILRALGIDESGRPLG